MWLEHVQFATTTLPELGTHEGAHSYSYSRYPIEQNVSKLLICLREVWVIPQPQPFFWSPDPPCLPQEPSQDLDCLHMNTYHTEDRYQVYILFNVRISILPTILHKQSEIQSIPCRWSSCTHFLARLKESCHTTFSIYVNSFNWKTCFTVQAST